MKEIVATLPCFCGSGKLFVDCCLKAENFSSLEDLNHSFQRSTEMANTTGIDDFCGLSPDQMNHILYSPFQSETVVRFNPNPNLAGHDIPAVKLLELLKSGICEKGLKSTVTGNLPRKLSREIAEAYWGQDGYAEKTRFGGIQSETDVIDLHFVRVVAECCGLIRERKNKFFITKKWSKLSAGEAFFLFFQTWLTKFNWAYLSRFDYEVPIIQRGAVFSLFLLNRFGQKVRDSDFYADAFLKAFPMGLGEVSASEFRTREEVFARDYDCLTMARSFNLLGLATYQFRRTTGKSQPLVKRTAFFSELVQFQI